MMVDIEPPGKDDDGEEICKAVVANTNTLGINKVSYLSCPHPHLSLTERVVHPIAT
jgi:hypothetical protein